MIRVGGGGSPPAGWLASPREVHDLLATAAGLRASIASLERELAHWRARADELTSALRRAEAERDHARAWVAQLEEGHLDEDCREIPELVRQADEDRRQGGVP